MARQDQSVSGGEAYQAGAGITVHKGMTEEQMVSIMTAMASQLSAFSQEANRKVDERLNEFRDAFLEQLSNPENEANTEAFSDPDYQYAVHAAQKSFVRDGSEKLRNELIGLLVQRSKFDSTDRVAKVLNQALETAGNLSKSEYAALAIYFILTQVRVGAASQANLFEKLSRYIAPFVDDLTDNFSCYEYLESQRCISLNAIMTRSLSDSLCKTYGALLGLGVEEAQILAIASPHGANSWTGLIGRNGNVNRPFFFIPQTLNEFTAKLTERGFVQDAVTEAGNLYNSAFASEADIAARFDAELTGFAHIKDVWANSHLQQMTLTAVGKVIAHSAQTAKSDFSAPQSIWVS